MALEWTAGGRGPLSKVRPDEFLRKLDHRGYVAEINLLPPGVCTRTRNGRTMEAHSRLWTQWTQ
jgi:hypothetical protein